MRPNKITWALLVLSIIAVTGIIIYVAKTLDIKTNADDETTASVEAAKPNPNSSEDSSNPNSIGIDPGLSGTSDSHRYVFVGDSRYVAMSSMKGPNDTFICDNGVGRYFLQEKMKEIVDAACYDNSRIVIGLGVNDITASDEYIEMLKDLRSRTDVEIFYALVNPVDDYWCNVNGYNISNAQIDRFNEEMIDGLKDVDITIIDTNSHLKEIGYECSDGLHYTTDTYINIFQYLKVTLSLYP